MAAIQSKKQQSLVAKRKSFLFPSIRGAAWLLVLVIAGLASPAALMGQTFQSLPALVFTKTVNSTSNPLPQVITVASTGANFNFFASVVNGTGGNWLTQSTNSGYSQATLSG